MCVYSNKFSGKLTDFFFLVVLQLVVSWLDISTFEVLRSTRTAAVDNSYSVHCADIRSVFLARFVFSRV